jgi:eukaryotic-like serine/threonine-protein kinase
MDTSSTDRGLLYGVLAVQMGFLGKDALVAAMASWALTRWKRLDQILIEQAALAPDDRPLIEQVFRHHVDKNGDPEKCLAQFDADLIASLRAQLRLVEDMKPQETIANLGSSALNGTLPDPEGTTAWAGISPDGASASASSRLLDAKSARFRVLRPHAKGGLGEVYIAWDEELERNVALKEIRAEHSQSERLRERFVREAEINGNLEHPGIVPVYGLGAYPDGRPYYAMRFVEGETLKVALERFHAEAPRLDASEWAIGLRQLLRRFIGVCDSIDYAHSRGVLHRDLKPSNILLGKFGETLIIDWGLAKIIGKSDPHDPAMAGGEGIVRLSTEDSHFPTLAGETMGSPPFMSPEQARGCHADLTSASDIYSLGSTLFAVLTGRPPVDGAKTAEILDKVGRGEIIPPAKANPRVPQPLAAICLKAMQLEPSGRYGSARALADDLECWLDDRPVAIYQDSTSTRLLRWSRHHKSLVASSFALAFATFCGLVLFALVQGEQKRQAVIAQQQTEAARRRAKDHLGVGLDVVDQLVTFGDRQLITRMSTSDRDRFLRAASNFIHQFREREPGDQSIQIQTAQVARRLANLNRLTGKFDRADPFYSEALLILGSLNQQSPSPRYGDLTAETLIDQGEAWTTRGRVGDAEKVFREARDIARRNAEAFPENLAYQRTLARSITRLGSTHLILGRTDVVELVGESLAIVQPLAEAARPTVKEKVIGGQILPLTDQLDLIQTRYTLAEGLEQAGRSGEAEDQLRQALALTSLLADRFQGFPIAEIDYFQAWVETRLARTLSREPKGEEPLQLLEDAVTRLEALVKQNNDIPHYRASLAEALGMRASVHERAGSISKASDDVRAAQTAMMTLLNGYRDVPDYADLMAEILAAQGRLARREGADPIAFFERAIRYQKAAVAACRENPAFAKRLANYEAFLKEAGPRPTPDEKSPQPR